MNSIGKQIAPFSVKALVDGDVITLTDADLHGRYSVLFFYPLDFTFVCPTEIHALQEKINEFTERRADVYAISVDSIHAHRAWLEMPKAQGGIAGTTFPLVSDINRELTTAFNVLHQQDGVAFRGTFILDEENVLQHISVNNLSIGRSVEEMLRILDALSFVEAHGDKVCPANWTKEKPVMTASASGLVDFFKKE